MKFKVSILFVLSMVFLVSCKPESRCDCVKSTGKTNVIYHDVKDFTSIITEDKMEVYLTQGPNYEVKVEAGANLQKLIKTELDGETLKVVNKNKCNWVRGYKHTIKVYITAPYFKYIKNAGVGTIESLNTITQNSISVRVENSGDVKLDLNTDEFVGSTHGNGDLYLTGTTKNFAHTYNGTNFLYAKDLNVTGYIYLHSISIGSAYVTAPSNGLMDVIIDRSGNVYYKGNPSKINLTRNNKGTLIAD